jgi:BolA protein
MSENRVALIESRLNEVFRPSKLQVKDQSHLHAGHAGAEDGRGHFEVTIVSADFEGRRPLERHRMVFDALGSLMQTDIHALRLHTHTPAEK